MGKGKVLKLVQAILGLAVLALGLVMLIAGGGPDPWGMFLLGLQGRVHLSLGITAQLGGLVLIVINIAWGRRYPGVATVLSMLLVGLFLDMFLALGVGGSNLTSVAGLLLLGGGIVVMSLGIVLYVEAGLGEGPVEGLMFVLSDKLKLPVSRAKILQDCIFVLLGVALGCPLRLGTLATALCVGPVTGYFLRLFRGFGGRD